MNNNIEKVTTKNRFYRFFGLSFLSSFIIIGFGIISLRFFNSGMNTASRETGKPEASKSAHYIRLE
jgi:hypothetical protein